jgi:hypothetical protein
MAHTGGLGSQQAFPLLKVDRPCSYDAWSSRETERGFVNCGVVSVRGTTRPNRSGLNGEGLACATNQGPGSTIWSNHEHCSYTH